MNIVLSCISAVIGALMYSWGYSKGYSDGYRNYLSKEIDGIRDRVDKLNEDVRK